MPAGLSQAELTLYRQGHAGQREGRPGEAIAAYRQLVSRRPDLADVWAELASLYALTGAWEHALAAYRHRLELRPGDALAWHNLAVLLQSLSRPAEAVVAFREALRLEPEIACAWYGLGCAHRRQAQHPEALSAFQQAVRFDPGFAQAWYRLGNLHEHQEECSDAIRAYRQAVRSKPAFAAAWYRLGVLCRDDGQIPQAIEALLAALRLKPHDTEAWVDLGITYSQQRNRKGVLDVYEELAILEPAAAEAFASHYVDKGSAAPEAARALPPSMPGAIAAGVWGGRSGCHPLAETWYEMGVAHRKQGDLAEALSDFVEAVRFDPDHGKSWFCLAALYRAANRLDEALHALREVVRLKPGLAVAWHDLATIQAQRGRHHKAMTAFRKVIELQPENVGAWLGLGRECIALEHDDGLANVLGRLRVLDAPSAERLAREYASAPRRPFAPSFPEPRPARKPEAIFRDASSFGAWLLAIDAPPMPLAHAGLGQTA